jgi:hypothetical protein
MSKGPQHEAYKGNNYAGDGDYVPRPNDFIDFQGELIPTKFITSIVRRTDYDRKESRPVYLLVINPDPTERMFYHDTTATFYSEDARETFRQKLKEQLFGCNIQFTDI